MKASDLFVKALEREGVEYVFGIPGEENLDFLDFLDSLSRSTIRLILTRHEQAAGFRAALAEVNDSAFGLQAGVFTRDLYKMQDAWDTLDVGGVVIGDVPS